jgi:hypothetical protein
MEMSPQEKNAEIGAGRKLRPPERFFKIPIWRNIILVHGIKNKGTGIPNKDMVIAEKRKADWEARNCI